MKLKKVKKIPKFYLKDRLFNQLKVEKIAGEISLVLENFDKKKFTNDVLEKFGELELKQRIFHISDMLDKHFQKSNLNYLQSLEIILKALPKELDNTLLDGDYGDFIYAPYGEYISKHGLNKNYLKKSLQALEEITKRFSMEYAVRDFWNNHEEETYKHFLKLSKSKKYHVRRLASEGSRPRLPWGKKINIHYSKTENILDNLFFDKTRYVTRSVANHLNDISKMDSDFVFRKLKEWENSKKQNDKEMAFIKNHATRTLRKKAKKMTR